MLISCWNLSVFWEIPQQPTHFSIFFFIHHPPADIPARPTNLFRVRRAEEMMMNEHNNTRFFPNCKQTNRDRTNGKKEGCFFLMKFGTSWDSREFVIRASGVSTNHHENCLKEFLILSFRLLTFIAGVLVAVAAGLLLVFCGAAALASKPSAFTSRAHWAQARRTFVSSSRFRFLLNSPRCGVICRTGEQTHTHELWLMNGMSFELSHFRAMWGDFGRTERLIAKKYQSEWNFVNCKSHLPCPVNFRTRQHTHTRKMWSPFKFTLTELVSFHLSSHDHVLILSASGEREKIRWTRAWSSTNCRKKG